MVQANFGRYDEKFHYVRGEFFLFLKVKKKGNNIYLCFLCMQGKMFKCNRNVFT